MIAKKIKGLVKFPIKVARKRRAIPSLAPLTSHDHPKINAIGGAMLETLLDMATENERMRFGKIEARRRELSNLHTEILVLDYGAGKTSESRTDAEMKQGVPTTVRVSQICSASKPEFWARFLYRLIRKLKPSSCIELGSCVGISAAYQATALRLNNKGKFFTLEGAPVVAEIAEATLNGLGLAETSVITGPFHETLKSALAKAKPVDYFFNDGHHDHDAVIRYFNDARPYLSDETVVVIDDIAWSAGMRQAWREIQDDRQVAVSIDFGPVGVALFTQKPLGKEKYSISL